MKYAYEDELWSPKETKKMQKRKTKSSKNKREIYKSTVLVAAYLYCEVANAVYRTVSTRSPTALASRSTRQKMCLQEPPNVMMMISYHDS